MDQRVREGLAIKAKEKILQAAQQLLGVKDALLNQLPSSTHSFRKPGFETQAQAQEVQQPAQMTNLNPSFNKDSIRKGVLSWSKGDESVPVLKQLDTLYNAGVKFEAAGLDPYLPTILTLRETQGGRDLNDPEAVKKKYGTHNYYNIRNIRDKQGNIIGQPNNPKPFIDYPSFEVATMGGDNNGIPAKGLTGTIVDRNGIYKKYNETKKMEDFFNSYSSPEDGNGPLEEQVQNYNWFRGQFN